MCVPSSLVVSAMHCQLVGWGLLSLPGKIFVKTSAPSAPTSQHRYNEDTDRTLWVRRSRRGLATFPHVYDKWLWLPFYLLVAGPCVQSLPLWRLSWRVSAFVLNFSDAACRHKWSETKLSSAEHDILRVWLEPLTESSDNSIYPGYGISNLCIYIYIVYIYICIYILIFNFWAPLESQAQGTSLFTRSGCICVYICMYINICVYIHSFIL